MSDLDRLSIFKHLKEVDVMRLRKEERYGDPRSQKCGLARSQAQWQKKMVNRVI